MAKQKQMTLSYSNISKFKECPAALLAYKEGKYAYESTESMFVGKYTHALLESPESGLKWLENEENYNRAVKKTSKTGELKIDYVRAQAFVDKVKENPLYQQYHQGNFENEVTLKHENYIGIIDTLHKDTKTKTYTIVDYKTTKDFESVWNNEEQNRVEWYHDYLKQLGLYYYLLVNQPDFPKNYKVKGVIFGITKSENPNFQVINVDFGSKNDVDFNPYTIQIIENLCQTLEYYSYINSNNLEPEFCGKCAYCASNGLHKVINL